MEPTHSTNTPNGFTPRILETPVLLQIYQDTLKDLGKESSTVESYSRDARTFLAYLALNRLSYNRVEPGTLIHYQDYLRHERLEKDNSVRRAVVGIRQFYRFLVAKSFVQSTPFDEIPIPPRDESFSSQIDHEILDRLLLHAHKTNPPLKSCRDCAILCLLGYEGIKAHELISLKWKDLLLPLPSDETTPQNTEQGLSDFKPRTTLHVRGQRTRVLSLTAQTTKTIIDYRGHYDSAKHPALRRTYETHMFCAFKGREAATPLPSMTRHGLKFMLYEIGQSCGIEKLNTEQLRHHAVQFQLEQGKSMEEIMIHLGLRRPGNISKHLSKTSRTCQNPL